MAYASPLPPGSYPTSVFAQISLGDWLLPRNLNWNKLLYRNLDNKNAKINVDNEVLDCYISEEIKTLLGSWLRWAGHERSDMINKRPEPLEWNLCFVVTIDVG